MDLSYPKYGWHEPDERDHEALREEREAAEEEKADRIREERLTDIVSPDPPYDALNGWKDL